MKILQFYYFTSFTLLDFSVISSSFLFWTVASFSSIFSFFSFKRSSLLDSALLSFSLMSLGVRGELGTILERNSVNREEREG